MVRVPVQPVLEEVCDWLGELAAFARGTLDEGGDGGALGLLRRAGGGAGHGLGGGGGEAGGGAAAHGEVAGKIPVVLGLDKSAVAVGKLVLVVRVAGDAGDAAEELLRIA